MEKCTLKMKRETIKGGKTGWEQNVRWCCGNRTSGGRGTDCSSFPDLAWSVTGTWDDVAAAPVLLGRWALRPRPSCCTCCRAECGWRRRPGASSSRPCAPSSPCCRYAALTRPGRRFWAANGIETHAGGRRRDARPLCGLPAGAVCLGGRLESESLAFSTDCGK